MSRRWLQAVFRYDPRTAAAGATARGAGPAGQGPAAAATGHEAADQPGREVCEEQPQGQRMPREAAAKQRRQGQQQQPLPTESLWGILWRLPVPLYTGSSAGRCLTQPLVRAAEWLAQGRQTAIEGRALLLLPPLPAPATGASTCAAKPQEGPSSSGASASQPVASGGGEGEEDGATEAAWAAAGAWAALALLLAVRYGARSACGVVADWGDQQWRAATATATAAAVGGDGSRGAAAPQQQLGKGEEEGSTLAAATVEQGEEAAAVEEQDEEEEEATQRRRVRVAVYGAALAATLEANEALVVSERLHCRRLEPRDARRVARLRADAGGGPGWRTRRSLGGGPGLLGFELAVVPGDSSTGPPAAAQAAFAAAMELVVPGGTVLVAASSRGWPAWAPAPSAG
jgi:hypothetical protein